MSVLDEAMGKALADLRAKQDEWIIEQATIRGLTVRELAEIYEVEYRPVEVQGGENSDFIFRATQEMRLKRREPARLSSQPEAH